MRDKKSQVNQSDVEKHGTISSKDRTLKKIPVDVLKSLYITTEDSVEDLARRYKLSPSEITRYIERGNWDVLRAENREKGLTCLKNEVGELVEDLLGVQKQALTLKILELKGRTADATRHLLEHDSLKAIDPRDGAVLKDPLDQPIYIKLPAGKKDLEEIKGSIEVIGGLVKLLQGIIEEENEVKKLASPKEVELDAAKLLEYDKKNREANE